MNTMFKVPRDIINVALHAAITTLAKIGFRVQTDKLIKHGVETGFYRTVQTLHRKTACC